jgi:hypothetical protein
MELRDSGVDENISEKRKVLCFRLKASIGYTTDYEG